MGLSHINGISQPQSDCHLQRTNMSSLKRKINKLEKLYEMRNQIQNKPRFGVKPRWTGNPNSFFGDLKEYLQTTNNEKLENLKRSAE